MSSSLETLPPELFRYILTYLSPEETSALAQTCRRINLITRDDQIWQQHFLQSQEDSDIHNLTSTFRYTYSARAPEYSNAEYLSNSTLKCPELPVGCTWQEYFIQRAIQDKHIRSRLNEIISTRTNRIYNAELISSTYGLLALDVLKPYFPPSSPGTPLDSRNLAREYYAIELARLISREIGLDLLNDMKTRRESPVEGKALINALFIIQCFHPHGILLSLNRLHFIGQRLINDSTFSTLTLDEKCQLILTTMKKENFLAANGGTEYYDLENSFLFPAFNGKPSIPLTLVAIFCALAEECGLIARPLGFPGEVMAQVEEPPTPEESSNRSMPLIISVFEGNVMSLGEINDRLADVLDRPLTHPLSVTPINDLVIRSARNMINSITHHSTSPLNSYGLYAAVSVLKILGTGALPFTFDSMMQILKEHFSMDIRFFEMLSSPMTTTANDELQQIRTQDANPPQIEVKRRTDSLPKFFVGQIFQHLNFNYWGVICGWDTTCMASPLWQIRMGIADLRRGASQPFYHILADDSSKRYVAEDNINTLAFVSIENDEEKHSIVEKLCVVDGIGKQFERTDIMNAKFIPTAELRNEYPDDFV